MTTAQQDRLIELWATVMVALVHRYQGNRIGMWTRVPNATVAAARQNVRLARWQTDVMRMLGIDDPGSRGTSGTLGEAVQAMQTEVRSWFADEAAAERAALRAVATETAAVVAAGREMWDAKKAEWERQRAEKAVKKENK